MNFLTITKALSEWKLILKDCMLITMGVGSACLGLKGFLLPNHFLDGGVTGASLLVERLSKIELSILIAIFNLPFIYLAYRQFNLIFAIKSVFAIFLLASAIHFIHFPTITADKLLIAIFGGFFLGAGIGLSIRGGAVIDGTEVLAVSVSRNSTLSVGDFIALFNIILFSFSALLINIETAMYSMLTYIAASRTADFIIHGIEEYIGITIISSHALEIKNRITQQHGYGATVYPSISGYGKTGSQENERNVIFVVVTRLEVSKVLREIDQLDDQAFIVQHSIKEMRGGIIKKRPMH